MTRYTGDVHPVAAAFVSQFTPFSDVFLTKPTFFAGFLTYIFRESTKLALQICSFVIHQSRARFAAISIEFPVAFADMIGN